ncbi:tight adherence protein C [Thermomonospora echinospora]|uniref:Tight adherence protein C n=1 Tax=Thermomonospora echinospora TaxID=1992 RepID=A0A1H6A5D6_9ACTN|nr:type II secretion system F family protein [Thermomonospora echinospora]SEG43582.1 tight adherence protein C [Thermomonospora echinospora]
MVVVMASGGALCVVAALWGYALARGGERVAPSALAGQATGPAKPQGQPLHRMVMPFGRPFTGWAMGRLRPWHPRIRRRIDAAGRPAGMTVESYVQSTMGYVVLFGSLSLLLVLSGQLLIGLLFLVGVLQNELNLVLRASMRRDQIERSLPDFLDVLAVTVSAGLSFRHSLARVAESMPGPLADEFFITLRQMELGTPRRDAFQNLRERNRSGMLGQFVTAILQAEELGAPLASALIGIAQDMRRESAQWAKRKAQRVTPRVTLVTTVMAMPAMGLLMLGALLLGSESDFGNVLDR